MSRISLHIDERGTDEAAVKGFSTLVFSTSAPIPATNLSLDHGLVVSWHTREGGGVWAQVCLPLLESMEEMAAMVGETEGDE